MSFDLMKKIIKKISSYEAYCDFSEKNCDYLIFKQAYSPGNSCEFVKTTESVLYKD